MGGLSWWHWLVVGAVFILLFGAKRLPQLADGMGKAGGVGERASRLAIAILRGLVLHFGEWQVRVDAVVAQEIMERVERWFRQVSGVLIEASAEGVALRTSLTGATIEALIDAVAAADGEDDATAVLARGHPADVRS